MQSSNQSKTNMLRTDPNAKESLVYHYTTATGALGIISSRTIRLIPLNRMNDLSELSFGFDVFKSTLNQILPNSPDDRATNIFKKQINSVLERTSLPNFYSASFSEEANLLSQWRAYANPSGYSLGFSLKSLQNLSKNNKLIFKKITYDHSESQEVIAPIIKSLIEKIQINLDPTIESDFRKIIDLFKGDLTNLYCECAFLKHEGFSEEKEWRLVTMPYGERGSSVSETHLVRANKLCPIAKLNLIIGNIKSEHRNSIDMCIRTYLASPDTHDETNLSIGAMSSLLSHHSIYHISGGGSYIPLLSG